MAQEPPAQDQMHYEAMAQEALRGVIKAALKRAASPEGLPGAHHFYITFKTEAPGVSGPVDLLSKYPDEMTIVLQHQYWDLEVDDEKFTVMLSFNNVPERLTIPLAAITILGHGLRHVALQFQPLTDEERTVHAARHRARAVHALARRQADHLLPVLAQQNALPRDVGEALRHAHDVAARHI